MLVTLSKIGIILVAFGPLGEKRQFILAVVIDIVSCLCGFNISPGNDVWQLDGTAAELF